MTTATPPVKEPKNYLNAEHGLRSWLLTQDHKRIAILYLIAVSAFFVVGGLMAVLLMSIFLLPVLYAWFARGGDVLPETEAN